MAAHWALIEPLLQQRNSKDKAERPSSRAFQGITFNPFRTGVRWSEVAWSPVRSILPKKLYFLVSP
jgi:hypothetical protein